MASIGTLEIQMMANVARLRKDMGQAKSMVSRSTKAIESSAKMARNALSALGLGFGVVGVVRAFRSVISVQADFQQSISELSAITGATGDSLGYLSRQAMEMGATTTFSASQAAEAFKLVASAKPDLLENSEALSMVTREALTLAEAAGSTLPEAANTLGSSLNQFQKGAEDASRFINVLAAGSKFGASAINDTSMALKVVGTVAGNIGLSFEDTNAALQVMSTMALKSSEAGTGLRGTLLKLEKQANDKFKPSVVGLSQAFVNLKDANLSTTEQVKLFGIMNVTAAKSLIVNAEKIQGMTTRLTGTNVALEQSAIRINNLTGDTKALNSAFQAQQIILGEKMNPSLRVLVKGFTDLISPVKQTAAEAKNVTNEALLMALYVGQAADIIGNAFNGIWFTISTTARIANTAIVQLYNLLKFDFSGIGKEGRDSIAIIKRNFDDMVSGADRFERQAQSMMVAAKKLRETIKKDTAIINKEPIVIPVELDDKKIKAMRKELGDNITSGIMDAMENSDKAIIIFRDTTKKIFKDMVLEPQIKAAVMEALPIFNMQDAALTANTAAVNANTSALGASSAGSGAAGAAGGGSSAMVGYVGVAAIVAVAAYLAWDAMQKDVRITSGIKGTFGAGGTTATGWERTDTRGGPFTSGSSSSMREFNLTARVLHDLNSTFTTIRDRFIEFGDQLGLSTEAVKNFSMSFNVSGGSIDDMFKAVGDRMAYSLFNVDVDKATRDYFDSIYQHPQRPGHSQPGRTGRPASTRTYQSLVDSVLANSRMGRGGNTRDVLALRAVNAIIESRLPEWFKYLRNEGESLTAALARIGAKVALTKNLMEALGSTIFSSIADFGEATIAMSQFVDKLGGIEDATSKASSFIQNFAPPQVLADIAKAQLESIGLPLLNTTAEWFELAQNATEEELAIILNNQSAIQAWLDTMNDINRAVKETFKKENFATMIDYLRAVGRSATGAPQIAPASSTTFLPSYASGTPFVPHDMIAQIHKGERITPAAANDELVTEIRALRSEVSRMRVSSELTAKSTKRSSDILRNVTQDGESVQTVAA